MIKLMDLLLETNNTFIKYGYHYTTIENYDKIKSGGLITNQASNYVIGNNDWILNAYGKIPIFLSTEPLSEYKTENGILLKVNVEGLDIAADLGTLIDYGAYIEEDGFWFENKPKWLDDSEYSYDDLQGSYTFDLPTVIKETKTFVVLENISVDRIEVIKD